MAKRVAVASGLKVGDIVVTEGGDRLRDGARVQLAGAPPAAGAAGSAKRGNGNGNGNGGKRGDGKKRGNRPDAAGGNGNRGAGQAPGQ